MRTLKAPDGAKSIALAGVEYEVDEQGFVDVDENHVRPIREHDSRYVEMKRPDAAAPAKAHKADEADVDEMPIDEMRKADIIAELHEAGVEASNGLTVAELREILTEHRAAKIAAAA